MIGRISQSVRSGGWSTLRRLSSSPPLSTSRRERPRESWNVPEPKDNVPKNEWRGFFHLFSGGGISIDVVHVLQRGIDLRPRTVRNWFKRGKERKAVLDQSFSVSRVAAVGYEIGAAHFIVHREGRVRFKGTDEWSQQDEDGEYDLPKFFDENIIIEAIDATGMNLVYEGIESFGNLADLKWLGVANCVNVDDWCIDRICRHFSDTLQHLDISNCTKITERGIAALARLKELKTLNLQGLEQVKDIKLLCILLEEAIPGLQITGIDYLEISEFHNIS